MTVKPRWLETLEALELYATEHGRPHYAQDGHDGLLRWLIEDHARLEEERLPLDQQMLAYFRARGTDVPTITTGGKILEEAQELYEAWQHGDHDSILQEVADVVLVAAVVARQLGSTVEAAIGAKTLHDSGRGEPKQDPGTYSVVRTVSRQSTVWGGRIKDRKLLRGNTITLLPVVMPDGRCSGCGNEPSDTGTCPCVGKALAEADGVQT